MTEALTGIDRDSLLAERAEAEAQLRAAEATLGIPPPASPVPGPLPTPPGAIGNGRGATGEDPGAPAPNSDGMDQIADAAPGLDVGALRQAAARARAADDALARAASEAAGRPLPSEIPTGPGAERLHTAESSLARALEIQDDLPAAWRRLVGALISATGMAIVIGALGWNIYWLLVPIALIAMMTVDLRVAGHAAREASVEAARELAAVGVTGAEGLGRIRFERARIEEAEARLAAARAGRDAAYARFDELAPGRVPSEVDEVIADYEADRAARQAALAARHEQLAARQEELAAQEAALAARTRVDAAPAPAEPESASSGSAPASPEAPPVPAIATEWWFGEKASPTGPSPTRPVRAEPAPAAVAATEPPIAVPPPPAPVRALAERLSAEGREALARIEVQLAALERVELAKRSLEWHESRGGEQRGPAE
ncbi:MAG: hypothetical protein QOD57_5347 [Actinomycetota bacterium]|nr:hypothetical protein [Actinomycetota bacterium]